jgi:hypothetical protein
MDDKQDPKETKQITGEKTNVGLVERAKDTAMSLKDGNRTSTARR